MRLWSLHPQYLDTKGLLALWRESLLAQKVLANKTKGYKRHPQLERFKKHPQPLRAIGFYLDGIYRESKRRGYHFDASKVGRASKSIKSIKVFQGQVDFEIRHLATKLAKRDRKKFFSLKKIKRFRLHPLFKAIIGGRECWEKQK